MSQPPSYCEVPMRVIVLPKQKSLRTCLIVWSIIIGTIWIVTISYFVFVHMRWWMIYTESVDSAASEECDPFLANTSNLSKCDPDWTPITRRNLRTMCAKVFTTELAGLDYYPAMDFCKKFGAVLAPMEGANEQENLMDMVKAANLQEGSIWIGAVRQDGVYFWELDKNLIAAANWDIGKPNAIDKDPDCVQVITSFAGGSFGKWNDIPCKNESFVTPIKGRICAKYLEP